MKTLIKFLISFMVGCLLIIAGLTLGGIEATKELFSDWDFSVIDVDLFSKEKLGDMSKTFSTDIESMDIEVNNTVIKVIEHNHPNIVIEAKNIYEGFDVYENDGRTIQLIQKNIISFGDKNTSDIIVYVPAGYKFEDVDVVSDFGYVRLDGLSVESLLIDNDAGVIEMNDIHAKDTVIDAGLSLTSIKSLECDKLDVDLGFGAVNVDMMNRISDYDTSVNVSFGSTDINHQKYAGISSKYEKMNYNNNCIEVNCAFGAVRIKGGI